MIKNLTFFLFCFEWLKRLMPKKREQVNPFLEMRSSKKDLLSDEEEDEGDELTGSINNLSSDEDSAENFKSAQRIETEAQSCEIIDILASKMTQGI